ncbi:hypothetical protein ACED63_21230 [Vibrio splendidus]
MPVSLTDWHYSIAGLFRYRLMVRLPSALTIEHVAGAHLFSISRE